MSETQVEIMNNQPKPKFHVLVTHTKGPNAATIRGPLDDAGVADVIEEAKRKGDKFTIYPSLTALQAANPNLKAKD